MAENKTCVLQFQTDVRILASIAEYLAATDKCPTTRGGIASTTFLTFYHSLVERGLAMPIDSVERAQILLEDLGLRSTKRDLRVIKQLAKDINESPPDEISEMAKRAAEIHKGGKHDD